MKKSFVCALFCLFAASSVYSQDSTFYVGASFASAEARLNGQTTDKSSGYEARFGYVLNEAISLEGNYFDFGTVELPTVPDGGGSAGADGFGISVVGSYPLAGVNLTGKVGLLSWEKDGYLGSIGGPVKYNSDGNDLVLGVGFSYDLTDFVELKVEYNDSNEFRWGAIGANYHF